MRVKVLGAAVSLIGVAALCGACSTAEAADYSTSSYSGSGSGGSIDPGCSEAKAGMAELADALDATLNGGSVTFADFLSAASHFDAVASTAQSRTLQLAGESMAANVRTLVTATQSGGNSEVPGLQASLMTAGQSMLDACS